jgi:CubicO group peptidase (beta-lactamase class C family)
MSMTTRHAPIIIAFCALTLLPAVVTSQPALLDSFDAYVATAVKDWNVPGLAIAIVKDGQVVFAKGYGVRELGKPEPVDTHTLFAIGSTTKAMTAALIGMLVDEKKVAWDDPVTKHLPWFQFKDPYLTREVTVRDLLTHRARLDNADYLWYGQSTDPHEILRRVRLLDSAYSLRSGFVYQNVMYAAAGAVVEAASGMPWQQMLRTRILEPLGMRETIATAATLRQQPDVASPHDMVKKELRVIENASVDGVAPAGSVWSSVSDMAKWMQFMLDGGLVNGRALLQPKTVAELFKPQAMVGPDGFYPTARLTKPHWTTYGLGWFQQDYRGRAVDFHTGSIDGMVAIHGLIRDERLGVYILANRDHAELRHALMLDVFDRYAGKSDHDWSAEIRTLYAGLQREAEEQQAKEDHRRVTGTSPSLALQKYAGTYSDPLFGDVVVTYDGTRLHARYGAAFVATLEHWNYDTFRASWDAAWRDTALLTFVLNEHGEPARLEGMGAHFARKSDSAPSSQP